MRILNLKITHLKSIVSNIAIAEYPKYSNEKCFDKDFVIEFLKKEYSEKKVNKFSKETNYLPFPFASEKLSKQDINCLKSNLKAELRNLFLSNDEIWEGKENDLKVFENELMTLNKKLIDLKFSYPCYILTTEDFEPSSQKIHKLFHEMDSFIFDYYFFIIYQSSDKKVFSIESSHD